MSEKGIKEKNNFYVEYRSALERDNPIVPKDILLFVIDVDGNNFIMRGIGLTYKYTPILLVDREKEITELTAKIEELEEYIEYCYKCFKLVAIILMILFVAIMMLFFFK